MSNEETATLDTSAQGDAPVSLVKEPPLIMQDLGRVEAAGAQVKGEPTRNNTRWIFDLVAEAGTSIAIQLLEHQSGRKLHPDKLSAMISPTSPEAWAAQPYVTHLVTDDGNFALHSKKVVDDNGKPLMFSVRVSVDTIATIVR